MFAPSKIVVGVEMPESRPWDAANLGAPTRLAVRQAFEVADAMSSAVSLVCVLPDASPGFFGSAEDTARQAEADKVQAEAVLEDLRQQYQAKTSASLSIESTVAFGRPWFEILRAASDSKNNMIICGVRDKGAIKRLLFGSTGLKLLRNAECPVWLVKPRIDDDADLDILASTDLSEVGEDILFTSVALGQALPVRLNILHVLDDELERQMGSSSVAEEDLASYRAASRTKAEDKLHEQLSMTDYRTLENGVQVHFAEGAADDRIIAAIKELDVDLLIMATSGRGGIPGMLFGNTAERLLPELPCSVLAIKPDDFCCPVKFD